MPHIHEKIDFTVDIFIVYNNKVLLRKHDKYGKWLVPGGHIDLDEDPNQAAIREVKEETGLDVTLLGSAPHFQKRSEYTELVPPRYLNRHRINKNHEHVSLIYFATSKSDKIAPQHEEDKSNKCFWLSKEELEKNEIGAGEEIIFYAKKALEIVNNQ